ncbi:acyl-CoA reductase-like NAD-dependent aldehyde dehydrogenase [Luteibacter sp. 1214]|jgi:acyl-CoA reductase-like NAD-dependent aldehyde dehydrogenase|uniref:aldehyde dehydrogenase family protein n=1 Tax=Luteibacter sp. 1214 TaxID=2817735 RepID=UPI00286401A3|nr:aldehyde dehydrogenase family protein [Luteibacter sp. 1214]MDR6642411.1 acyl-CoA reductase-like NAD-dependent aldehyde dehydrogenase [Luteibacter sp. 1214]
MNIFDGPYYLSIAGKLIETSDRFDVMNPATGTVLAQAPAASAAQLDEAIAAAKAAFRTWSAPSTAAKGASSSPIRKPF